MGRPSVPWVPLSPESILDELTAYAAVAGGGHMTELDVEECVELLRDPGVGELCYDVLTCATELALDGARGAAINSASRERMVENVSEFSSQVRRALVLATH